MGFPINFPWSGKMQQNSWYKENLGNWYSHFSHSADAFFPSDSHPMVYFITWEIHGFSHQFLIAWKDSKIYTTRETWDIDTHTFFEVRLLFFYHIPALWYSTSRQKCIGFPIIFQSTGKCSKINSLERSWDTCNHTSPESWCAFLLMEAIPSSGSPCSIAVSGCFHHQDHLEFVKHFMFICLKDYINS